MTVPLSVGSRLGPYEIHALIGAGGMGEVYRAIDTRLSRSVAIKVLPSQGGAFFVVPLDASSWKWDALEPIPGLEEQDFIREWTVEGVYTLRYEPRALRIDRVNIPSGARIPWKSLGPADLSGVEAPGSGGFFAMTPDAGTYAYSFSRRLSTLYMVDGLR
jgi:hypothetical protein